MGNKTRYIYFISGAAVTAALFVALSPERENVHPDTKYSNALYLMDQNNLANIRCNSRGGVVVDGVVIVSTHIAVYYGAPAFRCDYDNSDRRL